ncbi:hypothetical protein CSB45_09830 [candidate division KSB3 bacterium]|uniref:SHSP domain-containing protein n=1 Tax=candidate division KSB3 bacterium TaxID=2044937 RepID=A0A2G6E3U3_9BACT|nr:MAG: hypothetical protein CSB45_09830 [candidate division KSB3 bacterium]PIE29380.1 MAG: hypothetical protein CSA57_09265 [candidate division KSB3 bacterium]
MPVYTKWNAVDDMFGLNETLDCVIELVKEIVPRRKLDSYSSWIPAADMYETESAVILHVELTGIDKEALELSYQEGYLVLRGRRSFSPEMQSAKILRIERMYGAFQRTFLIPTAIDSQLSTASYENGLLYIRLVKRQKGQDAHVNVPITFT